MTGLLRSVRAELVVLRLSPSVWALILLLPALTLLNDYLVPYVLYRTAGTGTVIDLGSPLQMLYMLSPSQLVAVVTATYATLGPAVAVVLGALVAGGDWARGSLTSALAQGPGRTATSIGQVAAILLALTVGVGVNFGVAAVASTLIVSIEADEAVQTMLAYPEPAVILHAIAVSVLISAVSGALGVALGTIFRSAGSAIGAALIWYVGSQVLLASVAQALGGPSAVIAQVLPNASVTTLAATFGPVVGGPVLEAPAPAIDPSLAPWVLLAYLIAFATISTALMRRRDIN